MLRALIRALRVSILNSWHGPGRRPGPYSLRPYLSLCALPQPAPREHASGHSAVYVEGSARHIDERFHGNQHRRHGDGKAHCWENHQRCEGRAAPDPGNTEGTDGDDGNQGQDEAEA